MNERRFFVAVLGYSVLSFIAMLFFALTYQHTVDDGHGDVVWVQRDFGMVPLLIAPGALVFIVFVLVGSVRLAVWLVSEAF